MVRKGKRNDADDLPLDDRRWLTLTMAHHTLSEQLIGERFSPLASSHLMEGLRSGKLRCMRESRTNPSERERVPASFWQGLRIDVEPDLRLIQILRGLSDPRERCPIFGQVYGWAFYVWKPDFDRLWPSAKADRETVVEPEARTATYA